MFTLQQIDGRVIFSAPTLVCILAYSATAIASTSPTGWRAGQPAGFAVAAEIERPLADRQDSD